ncbi:MAG: GDCCVxC domain-containing (seleno)protein [Thermodesulfobacteriota bacterium]
MKGLQQKKRRESLLQIVYKLVNKEGDCCVFCSYGTVKCPPEQEAYFQ